MKKCRFFIVLFLMVYMVLMAACKQSNTPVISSSDVDKVIILVKTDQETELKWKAEDLNFLKKFVGNINLVFGQNDENTQRFDRTLTEKQKKVEYQVEFYNKSKIIQDIKISEGNKLTIDKKEYTIDEKKENALDSLKNLLLTVAR
ncbi:hypothetical protein ACFC89_15605 [Enterococcus casseliflavus]|uniref:hypothetical protein n=1 Tax=Enterococcus casseliflavus TaxID=37734 RepID=UPI0039A49C24